MGRRKKNTDNNELDDILDKLEGKEKVNHIEEKDDDVIEETKPVVKKEDLRIARSLVPIKFDPQIVENTRCCARLYPRPTQIEINRMVLMIDWFESIMDKELNGWRQKYSINEIVQKIEELE